MKELNKTNLFSSKSRLTALLLGIFLGGLGIHNFYLGKIRRGILKILMRLIGIIMFSIGFFESFNYGEIVFYIGLCMIFIPIIWAFFEWIFIALGEAKDSEGLLVINW